MSSRFVTLPFTTDPRDLMAKAFAYLQGRIPGWQPAEGNLDTWIVEAVAQEASDIATLATQVPKAIFRYLGESLYGFPPIAASAASVGTTWFANDNAGHFIPAGAQVGISDAGGTIWPFSVLADVLLPTGQTQTQAGQVVLVAQQNGSFASGLGANGQIAQLLDTMPWVDHIVQVAPTGGGVDAETDDDYLDRLAAELRLMSPRPILPQDFAVLARNVAGVQRAVAIDGYNPADGTFFNERMVCIVALDASGAAVSGAIKTAITNYLEPLREVNFAVTTTDATLSEIDVTVQAARSLGYSSSDVADRIGLTIMNYLNPTIWGITMSDNPNDPKTWNNLTAIRYIDLGAAVRDTPGVEYVAGLTIGLHGQTQSSDDLDLNGIAPLPFTQLTDLTIQVA